MRRGSSVVAVVLGAAILAGCGPSGSGAAIPFARSRLVVTGSSTVAPLVGEIARRFEAEHRGVRVDVQTGGSSRGVADVRQGTADIGMASRALTSPEGDLEAFMVALDGIAPILHRDNPVPSLTDAQIAGIFTGTIRRWSEVGGPDAAITVVNTGSGGSSSSPP